jgi:4-amino-4-deoxy-L-arabinose transferase-like glycosyltransferase
VLFFFFTSTAWLIFLTGRRFFNNLAGILGAVFYVLMASQVTLSGMTAEMELFANLPLTAAIFLYLVLHQKKAPAAQFIWVGVLAAICIIYKITFVGALAAIGISIIFNFWFDKNQSGNLKKVFLRICAIATGFVISIALVGGYFASIGLWSRLMLVFTLGFKYFNDTALFPAGIVFPKPFGFSLFMIAMNNIALLLFGTIGTFRLLKRSFASTSEDILPGLVLALWFIASLGLAGMRGSGFAHYVLVAIPPLALIGGIEISEAHQRWQRTGSKQQAVIGASFMTALIVIFFFARNSNIYREYITYMLIPSSQRGEYFIYAKDQSDALETANYLKSHTNGEDFIYVWSTNLQEFYYADRLPPVEIIWPEYVSAIGPPQKIFNQRTKYIVVDTIQYLPQWLIDGLEEDYKLETIIGRLEIYRRKDS